jgi:hypothetical protein
MKERKCQAVQQLQGGENDRIDRRCGEAPADGSSERGKRYCGGGLKNAQRQEA